MHKIKQSKIIAAFLGTITEFYDYTLYGFSAAIIATKFFASGDYLTNLANVFAIYYAGYLSKPIGSIIFGQIGDIYGRKVALSFTVVGIAVPTFIIGLLPEYSSAGNASVIILVVCRFLQGIFVAGEYDGAAIYVIEHLGKNMQFTASAITRATGVIGLLLGIASTNFFKSHIFPEWGWRIPFLLSLPLALISLYYRKKLDETPDFQNDQIIGKKEIKSLKNLIHKQWKSVMMVALLAGGFGVTYQVTIIFMQQYLAIVLPQTKLIISTFSILMVVCFGLAMPVAGFIADRFGIKVVINSSVAGVLCSSAALIIAIKYEMLNLALISCLVLSIAVAPFNALAHAMAATLFAASNRYRAISLGHTIGSVLMSGSANYVCLMFMKNFNFKLFPIFYINFCAIICLLVIKLFYHKKKKDVV